MSYASGGVFGEIMCYLLLPQASGGVFGGISCYDASIVPASGGLFGWIYTYANIFPPPDIPPDYGFTEIPTFDIVTVNYGSKVEQSTTGNVEGVRYMYKLKWSVLTQDEMNTLLDFFLGRWGRTKNFFFYHPVTLELVPVRFEQDLSEINYFERDLYNLGEVTLIELSSVTDT